jgi:hypothetical protein
MHRIAPDIEKLLRQRARTDCHLARHEQQTLIALAGLTIVAGLLLGLVISHIADVPWLSHPGMACGRLTKLTCDVLP